MKLSEKTELSKIVIKYAVQKYQKVFAAVSFGKDSRVLIDLILPFEKNFQFVFIDTGYEFPETLSFARSLKRKTKMNLRIIKPTKKDIEKIEKEYKGKFVKNDQYKCCAMKIPAIERILPKYNAWITGLRKDETKYRRNTKIIEKGKIIKANPIAFWTKEDVWDYIKINKLSHHPLYDKGYTSLGCKPCTTKGKVRLGGGKQGQFERAGRFAGSKHKGGECGLHTF